MYTYASIARTFEKEMVSNTDGKMMNSKPGGPRERG